MGREHKITVAPVPDASQVLSTSSSPRALPIPAVFPGPASECSQAVDPMVVVSALATSTDERRGSSFSGGPLVAVVPSVPPVMAAVSPGTPIVAADSGAVPGGPLAKQDRAW